jgi:predicted dehydrogenase
VAKSIDGLGGRITRDRVDIEREEPLKLQLASFIECASTGREPRVSGSQATAALKLAVEITKANRAQWVRRSRSILAL